MRILGIFGTPEIIWDRGESLRDYGINSVFVSYRSLNDGVIERVHKEGARVFAEIGIFAGKDTVERHPDLAPIGIDGNSLSPIDWYMGINPAIDWYREEMLGRIENILERYSIDGLWLDFIRYPCHWEVPDPKPEQSSFDETSLRKFEAYIGRKIPGITSRDKAMWILDNRLDDWTRWKCLQITSFCEEVKEIVTSLKPEVRLGIFSVPWREDQFDGAILKIIAQDFESLAQYIDVFSPMVYHLMCGFPLTWIREYSLYLKDKAKRAVVPIVQAVDEPSKIDNLEDILRTALDERLDGVIVFHTRGIFEDERKIEALKRVFHEYI